MSSPRSYIRAGKSAIVIAGLCAFCILRANAVGINVVEISPPAMRPTASPKIPLSADVEAKLKELKDKARAETAKNWTLRMTKKIDQIATVTGLGDDGRHALEPAARQAVDIFADSWSTRMTDEVRRVLTMQPNLAAMVLEQRLANVGAYASSDWVGNIDKPPDQEVWLKALRQTLTPAQAAAWDKAESDRRAEVEKEAEAPLKQNRERMHDQLTQQMLSACSEIESSAGLSREQSDKLETLAKHEADEATARWITRVERVLLAMEDGSRQTFIKSANMYIGMDEKESPLKQASWNDGVASLLTADENKRLQAARDASKAKRTHALALVMIALLDDKIAFTESQRGKLQPLAERLVNNVPELFPDISPEGYYGYSPEMFFAAGTGATDVELKPVLDDIQLKHWRNLSEPDAAATPVSEKAPDAGTEADAVERAISFFLYEKCEKQRRQVLETSSLKVEDVARVAGLSTETRARLDLAIRGAAEQSLMTWKWFVEQQIRGQLQEATPKDIKQRLDSIQDFIFQQRFFFGNRMGLQGGQGSVNLWEKTVDTALDAKQKEAWKKETDARTAFRDQAIAQFSIAEFDRKNRLSAEQWTKLDPIISGLVHDCSADISQVFASNNPWYMAGPYTLLPFAGVPDADLKAILTKDQFDHWRGSPENANASTLWQNIQQMHKQRAGNR